MKKKIWPQPTTPLRGDVAEITFDLYRRARRGNAPAAVQALYDRCGAYRVKPKRSSRGVIWEGRAYWWSFKGYYRPGFAAKNRRPLQHYIWERYYAELMPKLHEIWFRDRDHHNFAIGNLEMLHKSEVHRRCIALGEVRQISLEQRREIAGKRWTKHSRRGTAILLAGFHRSQTPTHKHNDQSIKTLESIRGRERAEKLTDIRRRARAAYRRRHETRAELRAA